MARSVAAIAGLLSVCIGSASWAGSYTESNMKEYMVPLEESHKTDEEKKGLEIFKQQYLIDEGWQDMEARMDMVLIDASGRESRRKVVKRMLEDSTQPDKTLGIFIEPADVRGTVMLTFEHSYGADDQWLFLPSLKRTKKINAENKSGSFLGTEFSWEDISTTELTKYHYKFVRDEDNTWVVERIPVDEYSGYSREVVWVNKDNHQSVKIEYYDRKGDLLKTLVLGNIQQYKGRYWRPSLYEMTNHQNKKKTVLTMSDYNFGVGLDTSGFSSLGMERIRLPEAK